MKLLIAVAALSLVTVSCSNNKSGPEACNKEQVEAFVEAVHAKRDYDKMIVNGVATDTEKTAQLNKYQEAVAKFQNTGNSCSVLVGVTSTTSDPDLLTVSTKVISSASIQEYVTSSMPIYSSTREMNGSERPMIFVDATSGPIPPSPEIDEAVSTVKNYWSSINEFSDKTGLNVDLETYTGNESGSGERSFFGSPGDGSQSGGGSSDSALSTLFNIDDASLLEKELARIKALLERIQNNDAIMVLIKATKVKGIEILNPYMNQAPSMKESESFDENQFSENYEKPTVFQTRPAYVGVETLPGKSVAVGENKLYVQLTATEEQIVGALAAFDAAQTFKDLNSPKEVKSEEGTVLQK